MKIVFLEPLGLTVEAVEKACENLKKRGHEVVIYPDRVPEKNIERAADADVVIESNMPLRKDFLDACPRLKMLSIAFTGLDHIALVFRHDYGTAPDIAVFIVRTYHRSQIHLGSAGTLAIILVGSKVGRETH